MRNIFSLLSILAVVTSVIAADNLPIAPAPVPPPASKPATTSIRGQISVNLGLDLQRPDLARAVIYLASDPTLDAMALPEDRPEVSQQNKQFVPNFLVVPRGTEVEFPNRDHFDHNVFSRSKAAPAFDLDRYPFGTSKSRKFDKTGLVQVFCNIHPSMRAFIFVTPNRFFTRADSQGRFELTGVPPGHYELIAWHERCEEKHQPIDIGAAAVETTIALEASRENIIANAPADRRAGYGVERGLGVKRERLNLPVVAESHPAPKENKP